MQREGREGEGWQGGNVTALGWIGKGKEGGGADVEQGLIQEWQGYKGQVELKSINQCRFALIRFLTSGTLH